jgi:hypothetical protein
MCGCDDIAYLSYWAISYIPSFDLKIKCCVDQLNPSQTVDAYWSDVPDIEELSAISGKVAIDIDAAVGLGCIDWRAVPAAVGANVVTGWIAVADGFPADNGYL